MRGSPFAEAIFFSRLEKLVDQPYEECAAVYIKLEWRSS
jgi:hypothetical protein